MPSREELLPLIVQAFVELGYRKATTAALAKRCQTQEPALYRVWRDKKAMFADAIDYVAENSLRIYRSVLEEAPPGGNPAEILLNYEAKHIGEFHNQRIVFAALPECGDAEIHAALQRMYLRIHAFIAAAVAQGSPAPPPGDAVQAAWGLMGLGTIMTIADELGLMNHGERQSVIAFVGATLLRPK